MISVRQKANGTFEVVSGHLRLKAELEVHGRAEVVDIGTGQNLQIHEVDGRVQALSENSQAIVEDLARAVIDRARDYSA